jgi:hypothetical protein
VEWNTPPQVHLVQEQPQQAVQAAQHKQVLEPEQQESTAEHKQALELAERLLAVR